MKCIIFPGDPLAVVHINYTERFDGETVNDVIDRVATQAVPDGVPYRIVDAADIPTDRSQRNLWSADFSKPDGHGGQA